MIVTCNSCKTKFRLDPDRLRGSTRVKVRCSRCGTVFQVDRPEEEKVFISLDAPGESLIDQAPANPSPLPFTPSTGGRYETRRKKKLKPLLLWMIPVILIALIVWGVSQSGLLTSESEKSYSAKLQEPAVTISTATQAYFLENNQAGQLFVVEGEVVNEGTNPVSFVLLEGKLYTTNNQVAQSQRCFCGNMMPREELTRLSIAEIQDKMMNREGKDMSNVHILPQHRVPFMMVFHNLPEMDLLSDYSVEVVSSQTD